jgi:DNA repair protein RecO (recombination protein O)
MTQREKILILRTIKYAEADLIVHALTAYGARVNFLARGARKSKRRFPGGLLEPTHYVEVVYRPSPRADADPLHTLQEARLLRDFPGLRTDYARLETALNLLKLTSRLGQQGTVDSPELFNLLGNALGVCETSMDLDKLRLHFQLKILAGQGVLPHEDLFLPFLNASLADHARIDCEGSQRALVTTLAHDHWRQYLGAISEND